MDTLLQCEECGKSFVNTAGLFTHQKKKCRPGKRSLQELLSDARDYWKSMTQDAMRSSKRVKLGPATSSSKQKPKSQKRSAMRPRLSDQATDREPVAAISPESQPPSMQVEANDSDQFSKLRFAYVFQFLTSIFSQSQPMDTQEDNPVQASEPERREWRPPSPRYYTTGRDKFGIFKRFFTSQKPLREPEQTTSQSEAEQRSVEIPPGLQLQTQTHGDGVASGSLQESPPQDLLHSTPSNIGTNHRYIDISSQHNVGETTVNSPSYFPYPNWSSFALGDWFWNRGVVNSKERFGELLEVLRHPNFRTEDVCQTNWDNIDRILPEGINPWSINLVSAEEPQYVDEFGSGWISSNIFLDVPLPNRGQGPKVKRFKAGVLHHRSLVSVIKEKMTDTQEFRYRHLQPFEMLWQPNVHQDPVPVYGDLYFSTEFRRIHEKIQNMTIDDPNHAGLERVVVALMFWSDATTLADYGGAKLWPCYLFFGNDSKDQRSKPSANLCNHIAYFETLPASFRDWYRTTSSGQNPSKDLVTHCTREIFHRQWDILLDQEFKEAMCNGIKIVCPDNVTRLFFPWIFTYSADYPEKANIATIRPQGQKLCPRCLMPQEDLIQMGTANDSIQRNIMVRVDDVQRQQKVDLARSKVFVEGYAIGTKKVDDILKEDSLVPVQNTFSKLSSFGFDVYSSLVVDLMHEFELGVWKTLFIHLIRILEAQDRSSRSSASVHELNWRYRQMPSFGIDTIRKFSSNASEQKQLGARDYENLLQCAVPAFDNLLPEPHNSIVCRLISLCAEWHALAKLRMHTEETVTMLETTTSALGDHFRIFINTTCRVFETEETAKEYAARLKRLQRPKKKKTTTPKAPSLDNRSKDQYPKASTQADTRSEHEDLLNDVTRVNAGENPASSTQNDRGIYSTSTQARSRSRKARASTQTKTRCKKPADQPVNSEHTPTGPSQSAPNSAQREKGRQPKSFNVYTYKYHALADFSSTIRRFGTTDSYTSERGEVEHKFPKSWFLRTNKKRYRLQLARIERQRANLRRIRQRAQARNPPTLVPSAVTCAVDEPGPRSYAIAKSQSAFKGTNHFRPQAANDNDPAYKDFLPDLKKHLKPRLEEVLLRQHAGESEADVPLDWTFISLRDNRIYEHKTLRTQYTAYNVHEEEDLVRTSGPKTHVMVLNPAYPGDSQAHPFLYARVHGIYHANVVYKKTLKETNPVRMDFLWVRWFHWEGKSASSYGLDVLSFPPVTEKGSFGFLDPSDVLRGCHIVPRFSTDDVLVRENRSGVACDSQDSIFYFVNPFADRDIYMRYRWGYAIGHEYSHLSRRSRQSCTTIAAFYAENPLVIQDIPPPPPQPFNTEFPPEPSSSELATTKSFGGESPVNEPCSDGESDNSDYVEGGEELGEDDMVFRGCDDEIDSDEIDSDEIDSDEIDSDEEHRDEIDSDEEHRDSERE